MIHRLKPALGRAMPLRAVRGRAHASAWESREGFALLTVLWLITALSTVVGVALATTRLGQRTTLNRIALTRGRWAAEACLAIVQARWAQHRLADTATIDLGRGMRCDWCIEDPTARVNVNIAEREVLDRITPSADSIVARRRLNPLADLGEVPDLDPTLLTIDGPGTINLSAAPRAVGGGRGPIARAARAGTTGREPRRAGGSVVAWRTRGVAGALRRPRADRDVLAAAAQDRCNGRHRSRAASRDDHDRRRAAA